MQMSPKYQIREVAPVSERQHLLEALAPTSHWVPPAKLLPTAHIPAARRGHWPALSPVTAGTPDSLPIKPVAPVHPSTFI